MSCFESELSPLKFVTLQRSAWKAAFSPFMRLRSLAFAARRRRFRLASTTGARRSIVCKYTHDDITSFTGGWSLDDAGDDDDDNDDEEEDDDGDDWMQKVVDSAVVGAISCIVIFFLEMCHIHCASLTLYQHLS